MQAAVEVDVQGGLGDLPLTLQATDFPVASPLLHRMLLAELAYVAERRLSSRSVKGTRHQVPGTRHLAGTWLKSSALDLLASYFQRQQRGHERREGRLVADGDSDGKRGRAIHPRKRHPVGPLLQGSTRAADDTPWSFGGRREECAGHFSKNPRQEALSPVLQYAARQPPAPGVRFRFRVAGALLLCL
ncbi:hypothetical protein NDU88_003531 [Pleurodeles waltl]|uniref:Uncharacterized protein n=1 Tax=Pleurodeles waltl TaxID=8319 RepID=A0AAV7W6H9_PLEWA|nr:hypothetical protein NDU88_003531 [Pleurodeles waltl]